LDWDRRAAAGVNAAIGTGFSAGPVGGNCCCLIFSFGGINRTV
jgi:hypothetical protein